MSDPAPAPAAAEGAAKPSKAPLIGLLVGALNLGVTGFLVMKVLHPPPPPAGAAAPAGEHGGGGGGHGGGGHGEAGKPPPLVRPVVTLDPFVVNLNEPGSSRYLKASFELEVMDEHVVEDLNRQKRVIRDDILRFLSSLQVAATLGEAGKTKIGTEVAARLNRILGAGKVTQVFFTEFVVQ